MLEVNVGSLVPPSLSILGGGEAVNCCLKQDTDVGLDPVCQVITKV